VQYTFAVSHAVFETEQVMLYISQHPPEFISAYMYIHTHTHTHTVKILLAVQHKSYLHS
jgi:hypothetical protein